MYVANAGGDPVGFYALVGRGSVLELEHLWIATLRIEAGPNAEGYYRRMGAERTGETAYEVEGQSRVLPLMVLELSDLRRGRPTL